MLAACNPDIFNNGTPVLIVDTGTTGGAKLFDPWVHSLAKTTGAPVDWHYSGGRAQVLTTGDHVVVLEAAKASPLPTDPKGRQMVVLRWCETGNGIFRGGS